MVNKLEPGNRAPEFSLKNQQGETVSLSHYKGKHVVLYFYPKAMTPGCTTQACDFRDNFQAFADNKYVIIGISPDMPDSLEKFTAKENLNFDLLSDPDKTTLKAYGAWGEKNNYGKISEGVIRSTFLINPEGNIQEAKYNVKATGHVAKLINDWNLI